MGEGRGEGECPQIRSCFCTSPKNAERLPYLTMSTRVLTFFLWSVLPAVGFESDVLSVRDFGAKGDGSTDDTAAFHRALDAATKAGGGTVHAPRGNYFFTGHLNVANAVTLEGIGPSVPDHAGLRKAGQRKPTDDRPPFLTPERAAHQART